MDKVSFELEVITPLFLGGADGKTPELRPPSIRGAMRFWFRAMMGGLIGNDLDQLSKLETLIFGGTKGEIAQASSVIVKCYSSNLECSGYRPLPHSSTKKFPFQGFNPNQHLNVEILLRTYPQDKRPPAYIDRLTIAKEAFELSCMLGGIGKRSRRGFGSLHPKDLYQQDSKSLRKFIETRLNQIKDNFSQYAKSQNVALSGWSSLPTFPVIHPSYTEISVSQETYQDWNELIKYIMQGIHDLQSARTLNPDVFGTAKPNRRQSSPLIITVHKLASGEYVSVLTRLKSRLKYSVDNNDWNQLDKYVSGFNTLPVRI